MKYWLLPEGIKQCVIPHLKSSVVVTQKLGLFLVTLETLEQRKTILLKLRGLGRV